MFTFFSVGSFPTYSWKNFDIFIEKFRHVLGKIPRNFSMLTPRIFCFTGDGFSEEVNLGKIPRSFYSKEFFLGSSLSRPSYLLG
jgi:hypothetical protein